MPQWFLPTVSDIVVGGEWATAITQPSSIQSPLSPAPGHTRLSLDDRAAPVPSATQVREVGLRAEREWQAAIAALSQLLPSTAAVSGGCQGMILCGPLPLLADPSLTQHYQTWLLTTEAYQQHQQRTLLPASDHVNPHHPSPQPPLIVGDPHLLPLLADDPQVQEPFCLVLTPHFSLVMVLRRASDRLREIKPEHGTANPNLPAFLFSFDPAVVTQVWQSLHDRLSLTAPDRLSSLTTTVRQFAPIAPDYRIVTQFTRLLLNHLSQAPTPAQSLRSRPRTKSNVRRQRAKFHAPIGAPAPARNEPKTNTDITLLQALAHEVRTPLATIRTLVRSLLRRRNLAPEVRQRLETIDHECTEQIDRFGLIFQAVELETHPVDTPSMCLTPTSLEAVFEDCIPRWQKQATRRNLQLQVHLPEAMPTVVSNPALLDQALTSLVDRFTRSLPAGSHIQLQVTLAGAQLKVQLQSCGSHGNCSSPMGPAPTTARSIGQILMFQPDTGSLSLNLSVAKNLFQALGGRLIVRQRPQQGEVLTVFLPLDAHPVNNHTDLPWTAEPGKTWIV